MHRGARKKVKTVFKFPLLVKPWISTIFCFLVLHKCLHSNCPNSSVILKLFAVTGRCRRCSGLPGEVEPFWLWCTRSNRYFYGLYELFLGHRKMFTQRFEPCSLRRLLRHLTAMPLWRWFAVRLVSYIISCFLYQGCNHFFLLRLPRLLYSHWHYFNVFDPITLRRYMWTF